MRILLIEDDRDLCGVLRPRLEQEGFVVDCCHDGEEGLYYLCQPVYDAAVLDRMLPGLDGVTLLARARAQGITTPVLLLTALDRVQDRVAGLDAGADDYLGKPFDFTFTPDHRIKLVILGIACDIFAILVKHRCFATLTSSGTALCFSAFSSRRLACII